MEFAAAGPANSAALPSRVSANTPCFMFDPITVQPPFVGFFHQDQRLPSTSVPNFWGPASRLGVAHRQLLRQCGDVCFASNSEQLRQGAQRVRYVPKADISGIAGDTA